ncbi:MAG TPA: preprotein translocase subunit SecG, partial [Bacteroidota bacterium]|nr:preprotein translocase subunit SecG [Bacteroidota bacterium]
MYSILVILSLLASVLLTGVVLLQSSKGTGLSGSLGGSAVGTVFGVRRTSDFLTKATSILAGALMFLCLVTNIFFLGTSATANENLLQQSRQNPTPSAVPPKTTTGNTSK